MTGEFNAKVESVMLKAMSRSEAARVAANARWAENAGTGPAEDWRTPEGYKDPRYKPANVRELQTKYRDAIRLYTSDRERGSFGRPLPEGEQAKFDAMHEQLRGLRGRKNPPTQAEKQNMKAYHRGLQRMLDGKIPQEWPEDPSWMPPIAAVASKNRDKAKTQVSYILSFLRNTAS